MLLLLLIPTDRRDITMDDGSFRSRLSGMTNSHFFARSRALLQKRPGHEEGDREGSALFLLASLSSCSCWSGQHQSNSDSSSPPTTRLERGWKCLFGSWVETRTRQRLLKERSRTDELPHQSSSSQTKQEGPTQQQHHHVKSERHRGS